MNYEVTEAHHCFALVLAAILVASVVGSDSIATSLHMGSSHLFTTEIAAAFREVSGW